MSEEVTFDSAASPVRTVLGAQRKARGGPLRCLRVCDPDQGTAFFSLTSLG